MFDFSKMVVAFAIREIAGTYFVNNENVLYSMYIYMCTHIHICLVKK